MTLDPRRPVLVGIGTCMQREEDFRVAREPIDLMLDAVVRAASDAVGAHAAPMLREVRHIAVPKGRWRYRNPAGEIARAIGAASATTVLAGVGVLQQTLIGDACLRIASGEIDSALVVGADAGYRIHRARQAGARGAERQQEDAPDVSLEPEEELLHPAELRAGIRMPVALYALLESAFRARNSWRVDEHRDRLARMLEDFSRVAASNPYAWRRQALSAAEIRDASERNPMQAFPYTRLHCTSWNVDQAAALLLCSAGRASALGIDPARWVHASASAESNHMVPVSARADLARCEGAALAAAAVLEAGGIDATQLDLVDLYSCFPIAVEACAEALGMPLDRALTVTGGMAMAGGPFNNYVLQATCRMAQLMRDGRGANGLVSCISGVLTKQAFGLWTRAPSANGFVFDDVTQDAQRTVRTRRVLDDFEGRGTIVGCTVLHDKGATARALVLVDTDTGDRALAQSADAAAIERIQTRECCGVQVGLKDGNFVLG